MKQVAKALLALAAAAMLLVTACAPPNGADPAAAQPEAATPRVLNLPSGAVYVDEQGAQLPVVAVEDGVAIECAEATDLVVLDDASGARAAVAGRLVRALVVGMRKDGTPDVWEVHRNGEVRTVDKGDKKGPKDKTPPPLPDCDDIGGRLGRLFGWEYRAVGSAPGADGEVIVVGVATNPKGITTRWFTIEPGTSVGVYWTLQLKDNGRYRLASFARVIGTLEHPVWPPAAATAWAHRRNPRLTDLIWRILSGLKTFFLGLYDTYLTDASSVSWDGTSYVVKGVDQDGEKATATITGREIVIEADEPPPPPPPAAYDRLYIQSVEVDGVGFVMRKIELFPAAGSDDPLAATNLANAPSIDFAAGATSGDVFFVKVTGDASTMADESYAIRVVALAGADPAPGAPAAVQDTASQQQAETAAEAVELGNPWEGAWSPYVLVLGAPVVRYLAPSNTDVDWFRIELP